MRDQQACGKAAGSKVFLSLFLPVPLDGICTALGANVGMRLQDASLQRETPFRGLEHTYFPARGGCRVTLYKDAHVGHVPEIPLADGRMYQPACCWIDLYNAICAAKRFIYVTGKRTRSACLECQQACSLWLLCGLRTSLTWL